MKTENTRKFRWPWQPLRPEEVRARQLADARMQLVQYEYDKESLDAHIAMLRTRIKRLESNK